LWFQIIFLTLAFLIGAYLGGLANLRLIRRRGGKVILYLTSRCETCVVPGPFYVRFPLFWYLILWGRCRRCGHPLKIQHLFYELVGGTILAGSLSIYGFTTTTLTSLLSTFTILIVAVLDFRYRLVPQIVVILGLGAAGITAVLPGGIGLIDCALGALLGGGIFLILSYLNYVELTPVESDNFLKMMTIAGAFLGLAQGILAFGIAATLWGIWRVVLALLKKRPEILPAGIPALVTTVFVLAYGRILIETILAT